MENTEKIVDVFAEQYTSGYFEKYGDDVDFLYRFIGRLEEEKAFGLDEISRIWTNEESRGFDVFYNAFLGDRKFYISVDFIEYMNSQPYEDIEDVKQELQGLYERIYNDIEHLKEMQEIVLQNSDYIQKDS